MTITCKCFFAPMDQGSLGLYFDGNESGRCCTRR